MARVQDEFLDENAIVAEAVEAFALDALEPLADVLFVIGKAHALAAAAGARLHHHRIADPVRILDRMFGVADFADKAGDELDAGFLCHLLRLTLVAHRRTRLPPRAADGEILLRPRHGDSGSFGNEPI